MVSALAKSTLTHCPKFPDHLSPLESFELILNYIATTSTRTGLRVTSQLNPQRYETGIRITDEQMAALNITANQHIPKWNYTISPCSN